MYLRMTQKGGYKKRWRIERCLFGIARSNVYNLAYVRPSLPSIYIGTRGAAPISIKNVGGYVTFHSFCGLVCGGNMSLKIFALRLFFPFYIIL